MNKHRHIISGPIPIIRDWRSLPRDDLTRGERICLFIENLCRVPEGDLVGQPVRLIPEQESFILAVYDNPYITDTAILSMARKNAKTALIAFLDIVHIVGPEAKQNSRIVSGAMSREQAGEVYNLASKCVMMSPKLSGLVKIIPSQKKMIGLPMNVEYQATSAEAKTAHGKSPIVGILDEIGQIVGPQSDFVDAITTAQGAYEDPLLFYISTQAATDGDLLSILIDDAAKTKRPKTVCHVYTTDPDKDLMDEEGWKQSNPGLGIFRSVEDMRKQAEKASTMPSFENTFRNLNLNQRVNMTSSFVSKTVWEKNGGKPSSLVGMTVYAGLDLSKRTDLTALVLLGTDKEGNKHVETYCWAPAEGIRERSHKDKVPYDVWAKNGLLRTTAGHTVDYDDVCNEIKEIIEDLNIASCAFDRWSIDIFRKACERTGLKINLVEHGQGFRDMSPALDALEADLLNGRIRHGMNPLLTMAAGNAVVTMDAAGGRKLDKSKATGRIDPMVALAMAEGAATKEVKEEKKEFKMFFIG